MKRIFLTIILLSFITANVFSITRTKLNKTIEDISVSCFDSSLAFDLEILPSKDFTKGKTTCTRINDNTFIYSRCESSGASNYICTVIVIRKEVFEMSDEFFDRHYAPLIAREFCHAYAEQFLEKGGHGTGYSFNVARKYLNDLIAERPAAFKKYLQSFEETKDIELKEFFDKYK